MTLTIDPNGKASADAGIYGLPFTEENSRVVYIPVPWDVTTSYMAGTHLGPDAIMKASDQIDLFDLDYVDIYKQGLFMQEPHQWILENNPKLRELAETIIEADAEEVEENKSLSENLKVVNKGSDHLNKIVEDECRRLLAQGKIPVVLGGDHSTPFGAVKAYADHYKDMGVLHIDAHSDNRVAYMGFEYSHASIVYNISSKIPSLKKIVQLGIRDFCEQEYTYTKENSKFKVYYDAHLQRRKISGESFASIAKEIVSELPQNVYITFDIDGLNPLFCPHTGTPVPGGLDYQEFIYLLKAIVESGKKIVGFDLVEVAPSSIENDEWDANVGMRLLYKMSGACLASQGMIPCFGS